MADNPWLVEGRVDLIKALWRDGLSGSQIALKLSAGISRNAVIGKLYREGQLRTRSKQMNAANNSRSGRKRCAKGKNGPRPAPWALPAISRSRSHGFYRAPELPADLVPKHLSIMQIDGTTCKFPYGDSDFTYCGHAVTNGSVYCMTHHLMSYTPVPVRVR